MFGVLGIYTKPNSHTLQRYPVSKILCTETSFQGALSLGVGTLRQ